MTFKSENILRHKKVVKNLVNNVEIARAFSKINEGKRGEAGEGNAKDVRGGDRLASVIEKGLEK